MLAMKRFSTSMCLLLVVLFLAPSGCNAQHGIIDDMASAEKKAGERARKELVAYMSLEAMFPDPQVRALAEAAGDGDLEDIKALVSQGIEVNARGTGNATPLFWAMRESNIKGFTELLELGADPNVVFEGGGTVMYWAVQHRDERFLKAAMNHGGDPNQKVRTWHVMPGDYWHYETLIFGALGEQRDKLDMLLAAGADVNARDSFGNTPVMAAAGRGSFDVVYKLLNHGADYSVKNNSGHTLVDRIADVRNRMDPKHELYAWMERVIQWLEEQGVEVPEEM